MEGDYRYKMSKFRFQPVRAPEIEFTLAERAMRVVSRGEKTVARRVSCFRLGSWFQVPPKDVSVRSAVADSGFRSQGDVKTRRLICVFVRFPACSKFETSPAVINAIR